MNVLKCFIGRRYLYIYNLKGEWKKGQAQMKERKAVVFLYFEAYIYICIMKEKHRDDVKITIHFFDERILYRINVSHGKLKGTSLFVFKDKTFSS